MTLIYHTTSRAAARSARQSGEYRPESLASQGFIHFSQLQQIMGVANSFYAGQKDLVILVVDPALLTSELKYEAPVHPSAPAGTVSASQDDSFPHLYGPLNFEAVIRVVDFPLLPGGRFELPEF